MRDARSEIAYEYAQDADRWIEIDLDAVAHNLALARSIAGAGCHVMAVVKADAYGLGAVEIARFLEDKADMLAVTTVEEGVELRERGIGMPILVFTPVNRFNVVDIRKYRLTATVDSMESINVLANGGENPHPCHLKINLGMNRLGCSLQEAASLIGEMNKNHLIETGGVYGHLAKAKDRSKGATKAQMDTFLSLVRALDEKNIPRGLAHLANSAAFLRFPESRLDMVRLGTFLYGQSSLPLPQGTRLKTPFRAYARVIGVRDLKIGDQVGYGGDFTARRKQKIAIVSIGFGDGFAVEPQARDNGLPGVIRTALQKAARLLVKRPLHYAVWQGKKLHLCGRVGMQLSSFRMDGYPIQSGDIVEVRIFRFSADSRLRRYYFEKGSLRSVRGILENQAKQRVTDK